MKKAILFFALILSYFTYSQDTTKVGNCKFRINEVDEFTGTNKKVCESQLFVSFTDSTLLKYYKNKKHQYIECTISCGKINDLYAVYFNWRIDTESAYKYFGLISSDAKFIVKHTDGTTTTLKFEQIVSGDTNYDMKYTTYSDYCIISEDEMKSLMEKGIDKVRMYWSKGYEDYPVIDSNAFINQLNCLK